MNTVPSAPVKGPLNEPFMLALGPALDLVAQPEKGPAMAQYMKSAMPFGGIPAPAVRKTVRELVKAHPFASATQLVHTVTKLWDAARYREERYAAIMATNSRLGRGEPLLLPFYSHVIETGQWWDYVDSVAPRLWDLLAQDSATMTPLLLQWSRHPNFWFRRAAIIAQLPAKNATDTHLLGEVITNNLADKEFFIRKAIGWALRQYARSDPAWVRDFVASSGAALSPLSRREALKHL